MAEQRCQLFLDLLASRSFLSDYDVARSSPRQFFPGCTIAMCGYDFREGQGPLATPVVREFNHRDRLLDASLFTPRGQEIESLAISHDGRCNDLLRVADCAILAAGGERATRGSSSAACISKHLFPPFHLPKLMIRTDCY
jgi:hypothetical protein